MTEVEPSLADVLDNYDLIPPVELFALGAQGVNNTTRGLHTGGGDLIWKTYTAHSNADTLLYEHHLLAWLDAQGLPFAVPIPLATRRGTTLLPSAVGTQALFSKLPGALPHPGNPYQARAVGTGLAQLHRVLRTYPATPRPGMSAYGDLERVHVRISDPFTLTAADLGLPNTPENAKLLEWWHDELAALRSFIVGPYRALPWQVIHSDFSPANTLFENEQLLAILDFEFASPDARVMDVAAGLVFILRIWEGEPHWEAAQAFLDGYQRVIPLEAGERVALPWLMRLRNVTAAIWWFGRDLETGVVDNIPVRITEMHQTVSFLEQNGERLYALSTLPLRDESRS
jgi:homoserine kinase type II